VVADELLATRVRERRIAHLAIHGWEPVTNRATKRAGIWNAQFGVGFSLRDDREHYPDGDSSVKRLDRDQRHNSYEECEWDKVTNWHLDRIDERLEQT
jgi:hypothetical protein